jgi:hypothetical protein
MAQCVVDYNKKNYWCFCGFFRYVNDLRVLC